MSFEHGHALVIGVGKDLPETIRDAEDIAAVLTNPDICAYPKTQVALLAGADATRTKILTALDELSKTDEKATVVVYFSGHGAFVDSHDGKQYYLISHDFDRYNPNLPSAAIRDDEFSAAIGKIKSKKRLLLLDCCHAGGLYPAQAKSLILGEAGLILTKSAMPIEARKKLEQGSGQIMIASSRASEISLGGRPNSAFTQSLLQALRGAGASQEDGYVRAIDLALHAREQIPRLTGYIQHPICDFSGADNFFVSYYAGGETRPKAMPATLKDWRMVDQEPVARPQQLAPRETMPVTYRNFLKFAKMIHEALVGELASSGVPDIYIPYEFDTAYAYEDGWYAFIFTHRSPLNQLFEPEDAPFYFALRIAPGTGQSATRGAVAYAYCILEEGGLVNRRNMRKSQVRMMLMKGLNKAAEKAHKPVPSEFVEHSIWFECGQQRIGSLDTAAADMICTWFLKHIPAFEDDTRRFLSRVKPRRAAASDKSAHSDGLKAHRTG